MARYSMSSHWYFQRKVRTALFLLNIFLSYLGIAFLLRIQVRRDQRMTEYRTIQFSRSCIIPTTVSAKSPILLPPVLLKQLKSCLYAFSPFSIDIFRVYRQYIVYAFFFNPLLQVNRYLMLTTSP